MNAYVHQGRNTKRPIRVRMEARRRAAAVKIRSAEKWLRFGCQHLCQLRDLFHFARITFNTANCGRRQGSPLRSDRSRGKALTAVLAGQMIHYPGKGKKNWLARKKNLDAAATWKSIL
jgi:hypothetical protein